MSDAVDNLVEINTASGPYKIYLPNRQSDYIQGKIYKNKKPYEEEILRDMATRIEVGELVLDIGANIGNHSLYLANLGANVICFEPNKFLCDALEVSKKINELTSSLTIHNLGLGESRNHAHFTSENAQNLGAQSLALGQGDIQVANLDSLSFQQSVKLIKIDVEGMELAVLKGGEALISKDQPIIYIECLNSEEFKWAYNWLIERGYLYWDTFNATLTHLFVPKSQVSLEQQLAQVQYKNVQDSYKDILRHNRLSRMAKTAHQKLERIEEFTPLVDELRQKSTQFQSLNQKLEQYQIELNQADKKFQQQDKLIASLESKVKGLQFEKQELQQKLTGVRTSLTYQLGSLFAGVRSPKSVLNLPKDLYRLFNDFRRRDNYKKQVAQGKFGKFQDVELLPLLDGRSNQIIDLEQPSKAIAVNLEQRNKFKLTLNLATENELPAEQKVILKCRFFDNNGVPVEQIATTKLFHSKRYGKFRYFYQDKNTLLVDIDFPPEVCFFEYQVIPFSRDRSLSPSIIMENVATQFLSSDLDSEAIDYDFANNQFSAFAEQQQVVASRCLIFGDISPNVIDGSSIWLSSISSIMSQVGPTVLLLKDNVDPDKNVLSNIVNAGNLVIVQPKHIGFNAPLTTSSAVKAIKFLDDKIASLKSVVLRGLDVTAAVMDEKAFASRVYPYLTDFYAVDEHGFSVPEEKLAVLPLILNNANTVLTQTCQIRNKLSELTDIAFDSVQLPPSLPADIEDKLIEANVDNSVINIGYAGKVQPGWGVEHLINWSERLINQGHQINVHVVTQKVTAKGERRNEFIAEMNRLLDKPFVTVYNDMNRFQAMGLMKAMQLVWCYRDAYLEDNTLEVSTKLIEMGTLSIPTLCYPSQINKDLLGDDYPCYVSDFTGFEASVECIESHTPFNYQALSDKLRKQHSFATIASNLAPILIGDEQDKAMKIAFAGNDLKFLYPYISYLKDKNYSVQLDYWQWGSGDEKAAMQYLYESDVIFCEWGLANAVWYSQNNVNKKPLYIRIHAQEVRDKAKRFGKKIDVDNVTKFIFVSALVRDKAVELFGWPMEKTVVIANFLNDNLLPMFERDQQVSLGMVGITPKTKRFDRALKLTKSLLQQGVDAKLYIKGHRPENLEFMHGPGRKHELEYYYDLYRMIDEDSQLKDAVIFTGWGNDVQTWYKNINYILSPSETESFHYALADGTCTGALPLVWPWPSADSVYPEDWIVDSVKSAAKKVIEWQAMDQQALTQVRLQNRQYLIDNYGYEIVFEQLDNVLKLES
ncbi:FkbM family methyltransferase [Thalassotalea sp. Y01]|uniref:FkbM family methyltransferase n=1 Tax=Thalassotalea sp. Y01 TaxID=2729613 RepID=UPI00145D9F44|nr:FkbM family methyltransferase [Thalassotalea sp. Y01]